MLIPGKSHSRIKSCNSRVSVETLDFARERTFCSMIGVGSLVGAQGGAIAGRSLTVFLAHAGTPSIDRHSGGGTPKTARGGYGGARPGKRNGHWPRMTSRGIAGCCWTVGRRRGRMGAQSVGPRLGLRHCRAPVETQAGNATGGCNRRPGAVYRKCTGPPSDTAG